MARPKLPPGRVRGKQLAMYVDPEEHERVQAYVVSHGYKSIADLLTHALGIVMYPERQAPRIVDVWRRGPEHIAKLSDGTYATSRDGITWTPTLDIPEK